MATNNSAAASSSTDGWIKVYHKPGPNPWRGNDNNNPKSNTPGPDFRPDNTFATWCIQERKIIVLNYTINGPKFICDDCEKKGLYEVFETLNYVIADWVNIDIHHIQKEAIETYMPNKCLLCKKDTLTLIPTIDCPKCEEIYLDRIKLEINKTKE